MNSREYAKIVWLIILLSIHPLARSERPTYKAITEALQKGSGILNFRLRRENALQDGLTSANATTLRTQVGYQSEDFYQNNISVELVNVTNLFGKNYNPATTNLQKSGSSVIADPKGTGITNANIISEYFRDTDLIFGRQYISLDNSRMVGTNNFRQFPTSFDALTIKNTFFEDFDIFYSYLNHINTYNNNDLDGDGRSRLNSHLLNVTFQSFYYGLITGYIYSNKDISINTNSQTTIGLRGISNKLFKRDFNFDYELEVAIQKNKSSNPNTYSTLYLGASLNRGIDLLTNFVLTGIFGYEFIGSYSATKPGCSFIFPLGTKHGFNGLAEGYTTIPDRGLRDHYIKVNAAYTDKLELTAAIHMFKFARGSAQKLAGFEFDLNGSFKFNKDLIAEFVIAKLNSRNNSTTSTKRISASISYSVF